MAELLQAALGELLDVGVRRFIVRAVDVLIRAEVVIAAVRLGMVRLPCEDLVFVDPDGVFVVIDPRVELVKGLRVVVFGCGVTTGIGAVTFTANVEADARAVVFGLGGNGCRNLLFAYLSRHKAQMATDSDGIDFGLFCPVRRACGCLEPIALERE